MAGILVIEDDPELRESVRRLLIAAGHEVTVAAAGRARLRMFRAKPQDVVIADLVMPEQDGIETMLALTKEFPKVSIIAMSGWWQKMGRSQRRPTLEPLRFWRNLFRERNYQKR